MKDKTVILENPKTTHEYVQYTWDGFRMFARGGLVLAWRGVKAGVSAIRSALSSTEKKNDHECGENEDAKAVHSDTEQA